MEEEHVTDPITSPFIEEAPPIEEPKKNVEKNCGIFRGGNKCPTDAIFKC